jgi:hypothetical protein
VNSLDDARFCDVIAAAAPPLSTENLSTKPLNIAIHRITSASHHTNEQAFSLPPENKPPHHVKSPMAAAPHRCY